MENIVRINVGGVDYEVRKDLAEEIEKLKAQIGQGTGTEGTTDYTELENKPQINGHELSGNKNAEDLGLQEAGDYALRSELPDTSGLATKDELNGVKPTIGENGNWFIGEEDTGVQAKGEDGKDGAQGNSGVSGTTDNIEVVNNLQGGESTPEKIKVLAAEQGKVLNEKFTELDNKTKNFIQSGESENDSDSDLVICDNNGNVLLRIAKGHVQTKNFDSANLIVQENQDNPTIRDSVDKSDLDICDNYGNVLFRILGGNIFTRQFDSSKTFGNQWKGKIWYAYGTSLTNISNEGKYAKYVEQFSGMILVNKGISGGVLTGSDSSIKNAIMNLDDGKSDADLITLECVANDVGVTLGDIYSTDEHTFCGALNNCIRYLLKNTSAQIVVISSTRWRYKNGYPDEKYTGSEKFGSDEHTMLDMYNSMRDICRNNGVYYIPMGEESGLGLERMNASDLYVKDAIHHTELGGYNLGMYVWSRLANIPLWSTSII